LAGGAAACVSAAAAGAGAGVAGEEMLGVGVDSDGGGETCSARGVEVGHCEGNVRWVDGGERGLRTLGR